MDFNETKAHGLLLGFFPGNSCHVIVYGMESLVTGEDKPKSYIVFIGIKHECETFLT